MHLVNDVPRGMMRAMSSIRTHNLGYPRIGEHRELKKATELFWEGKLSREELEATGRKLRRRNWIKQQSSGIDLIPINDFSFYDQVLDTTCLLGNVPPRFANPDSAVDAVRQALKTSRGDTIQVSRRLSKQTVKLLALRPGELRAS